MKPSSAAEVGRVKLRAQESRAVSRFSLERSRQALRRVGLTRGMMTDDDDAMRTIIELPDAQIEALALFCRREGVSRAEAIRRAVDKLVSGSEMAEAQQNMEAGFGLWRGRRTDGRSYVEALRDEWEERA